MEKHADRVEILSEAQRSEAIDVLQSAFHNHPMFPSDPTGRRSHLMVVAILDAFAGAPDATLLGISREGKLACVAFTFTYGYEPSGLTVALFLWRMVRALGWQTFRGMGQAMSEKHGGDGQRLELMLLGTRNGYQGQGLGRTMLRYLFDFARERGYASVVLETSKQTPAFEFYRHEGFVLEKEIPLPTISLCMMRRPSEGV